MKNLKVFAKMTLMGTVMLVFVAFSIFFAIDSMDAIKEHILKEEEENIRIDYDINIKNQVNQVITLLESYNADISSGKYSKEEGMKLAADKIRDLRYGDDGYFWVDQSDGVNVVLLGSDTEGTNRMNTKDITGYEMVKDFIKGAVNNGSYFCDYKFPKEGETEPLPKRAYTQYYEPFDWVIGTGNYTDNIDNQVAEAKQVVDTYTEEKIKMFFCVCAAFSIILILFLIYIIFSITKPLKILDKNLENMSDGNFSIEVSKKYLKRKDDFGIILNIAEKMRIGISGLVQEVKNETSFITDSVGIIRLNMNDLNTQISDVSATTEQLSAAMEETAAASGDIDETVKEIETATKNVAQRAQEGAQRADNIHKKANNAKTSTDKSRKELIQQKDFIKNSLNNALEKVKVVSEISTLAESITEITTQTNLLSLNARIEAARAGEAGKGFTVVADEIMKLAEESKKNTENIKQVTEQVNEAVKSLALDAEALLTFIDNQVITSIDVFDNIANDYNDDAKEIDSLVTDFSAISQELLASITNISNSVGGISRATNESAKGTVDISGRMSDVVYISNSVNNSLHDANEIIDRLNEATKKFKLSENLN